MSTDSDNGQYGLQFQLQRQQDIETTPEMKRGKYTAGPKWGCCNISYMKSYLQQCFT